MKHVKTFEEIQVDTYIEYHDVDKIMETYFKTALIIEDDNIDLDDLTIHDITDDSKNDTRDQIEWFIDIAGSYLNNINDEQIGDDLWLTRNNHGTGFWDRGYDKDVEDTLNILCKILGEANLEVGDDNKIRIYSSDKYKSFDVDKYKEELKILRDTKKYNL